MIKYFRQIRQNFLIENKTGKYFKYAIGEIVLVVIGILIALSINNWNENRKAQAKELSSFKEIVENLNYDILRCEKNMATTTIYILGLDSLRTSVGNTIDGHDKTTDIYYYGLKYITGYGQAVLNRSAYDEMISSGTVKLIENRNIMFNLSDYYERIATTIPESEPIQGHSNLQTIQNRLISLKGMEGYIKSFDSINPTSFDVDYEYEHIQKMQDLKLLSNDLESLNTYYNEIAQYQIDLKTYIFYMSWVKDTAENLILEIKKEYQIK